MNSKETIVAVSTAKGGAIGLVRLSGDRAIDIVNSFFYGRNLNNQKSSSVIFGVVKDEENDIVDEVLVSVFRAPHSYTKENTVEISCHGSSYIIDKILQICIDNGAQMAKPGEFTFRAFINGQMDLSSAEAVADLIASKSKSSHKIAMNQMRGGVLNEIKSLKDRLLHFISLIELELDFSEEDVEFADREQLLSLVNNIESKLKKLYDSFKLGNAIKNGVPISIIGKPNAGKSTLLNILVQEDRAIVSDIAGTTRDTIQAKINLGGVDFRFIDTAGIRESDNEIEKIGVEKAFESISKSEVVLFIMDLSEDKNEQLELLNKIKSENKDKIIIPIVNKIDILKSIEKDDNLKDFIKISALNNMGIEDIKSKLINEFSVDDNEVVITNARHYSAISKALKSVKTAKDSIENSVSGEFLSMDIRQAIDDLGEITGEITTDDILGNIFSSFCIGK